ncbi:MAG: hypothetical protein HMLKMBBP_02006 [Planctomycetes bacterium]|nr:hypothetical protein [Planctomycetota bacterium]
MNPPPPFGEALRAYLRIGLQSFGGPAAHIATIHRVIVEEKKWVAHDRFAHALNFCMLLPGPEATQCVTYCGWLLHGVRGGIAAGVLFVLPGAVAMLAVSAAYCAWGALPLVAAMFGGVKAAVLGIVAEAVIRIGKRALRARWHVAVSVAAFVAIFVFRVPFPLVVLGAAVVGWICGRGAGASPTAPPGPRPSLLRAARTAAVWLAAWFLPVAALGRALGGDHLFVRMGLFFSEVAAVTFGGAYAVLAYLQQRVVTDYGWITQGQMVDGLGLAETTPGPLILVLQFVAYVGGHAHPGALAPWMSGTAAAAVCLWTTFVPCFLWIFVGAPFVEALRGVRALASALEGITAAALGVISSLALGFALHVLFGRVGELGLPLGGALPAPGLATFDAKAFLLAAACGWLLLRVKLGMGKVILLAAAAGAVVHLAFR